MLPVMQAQIHVKDVSRIQTLRKAKEILPTVPVCLSQKITRGVLRAEESAHAQWPIMDPVQVHLMFFPGMVHG